METSSSSPNGSGDASAPQQPQRPQQDGRDRFFGWIRGLGITRSDDSWLGGVCAGLAHRLNIDPIIVRGVVVVLGLFGAPIVLAYILAWMLLPDSRGVIHAEGLVHGDVSSPLVVVLSIVVIVAIFWHPGSFWDWTFGWIGFPHWLVVTVSVFWWLAVTGAVIWAVVVFSNQAKSRAAGQQWANWRAWVNGSPATGPTAPNANTATTTDAPASGPVSSAPAATAAAPTVSQTPPTAFSSAGTYQGYQQPVPPRTTASYHQAASYQQAQQKNPERHYYRTGAGAAFTSITLGIALIAGAVAALVVYSIGHSPVSTGIAALIAASAVLALGVLVAGIRGYRSGGLGWLATLGVVALLISGSNLPSQTQLLTLRSAEVGVGSAAHGGDPSYLVVAGTATINLGSLPNDANGTVSVRVVGGNADVLIPSDHRIKIVRTVVGGNISVSADGAHSSGGAGFGQDTQIANPSAKGPTETLELTTVGGAISVSSTEKAE